MKEFRMVFAAFLTGVASGAILGMLLKNSPTEADRKKLEKEFDTLSDRFHEDIENKYKDTIAQLQEVQRTAAR